MEGVPEGEAVGLRVRAQSENPHVSRKGAANMGHPVRRDPFGGVCWLLVGEDDSPMDKRREFLLRLGVLFVALILMSSAMAAFFG